MINRDGQIVLRTGISKHLLSAGAIIICAILLSGCSDNQKKDHEADPYSLISSLIPVVKKSSFSGNLLSFKDDWAIKSNIEGSPGPALNSLVEGIQSLGKIHITDHASQEIEFVLRSGIVEVEPGIDTNHASIAGQAYKLTFQKGRISISANTPQGLYYGVQTLLQILKQQQGDLVLPEGEIRDWPDLSLRIIYWDDAHHLEKMQALKRIILQASQYKINAFAIKLEGHFEFKSAPDMVEPNALSAREYQELSDYAGSHYVELIPYLDAPAHVSFILKHPQYAHLRLFPDNNYEFDMTNPGTITLLKSMFSELLQASQGGKYVLLSTDEAYYSGKGGNEKKAAASCGSNGKLLARFVHDLADTLVKQGREVIFWGEFPLTPPDIPALPPYLINGEYNEMSHEFRKHGIRQLIYTSTQGVEPVFPNYYPFQSANNSKADGGDRSNNRVQSMFTEIQRVVNDKQAGPMGLIIAGWADAGLNPETFWLGYITGTAMGWNLAGASPTALSRRFYESFYGPSHKMEGIYQLLSRQAEFFDLSWDWVPSDLRKPILGNSEGIFPKPQKAEDQTIPILSVPDGTNLSIRNDWDSLLGKRRDSVIQFSRENDTLMQWLQLNLPSDQQNYNLKVLETVALLCKQNLNMLIDLSKANGYLKKAARSASANAPAQAIGNIDSALSVIYRIKMQRDSALAHISQVWYKEWFPLVKEANGRRFLQAVDDIKDHQPVRTIDLSYLIYRQLNYPLGEWTDAVTKNRNKYAQAHGLPPKNLSIHWKSYE